MNDNLIVVKQLPVIAEQLQQMQTAAREKVSAALAMVCSKETLPAVRKARAELRKDFDLIEQRRKEVKEQIMAPYRQFEEIYKQYVTDTYAPADKLLAARIAEIENTVKAEKVDELTAYFEEYARSKGVDFICFDDLGVKVNMNSSTNKLKSYVAQIIDNAAEDVEMIHRQQYRDEIMVEYKRTHNAAQALITVTDRHRAIEAEQEAEAAKAEQCERQQAAIEKVEQAAEEFPEFATPVEIADEKTYETSFTVRGTIEQLKKLKLFLREGGYTYEQQ